MTHPVARAPVGSEGAPGTFRTGRRPPQPASTGRGGEGAPGRIGPNALIQTARALQARYGSAETRRILGLAGMGDLLDRQPEGMQDERDFLDLVTFLWGVLPETEVRSVLHDAGRRTGVYVLRNRIPTPVRLLFRPLPRPLRLRLLLTAIDRHAWTFAGSGSFHFRLGEQPAVCLRHGPSARKIPSTAPLHAYYQGAIEELLCSLVAPATELEESEPWVPGRSDGVDFGIRFRTRRIEG